MATVEEVDAPVPRLFKHSRKRLGSSASRELLIAQLGFATPAILYIVAFYIYPIIYNVRMSLTDYTTTTFYTGEAPWVGLANFVEVFKEGLLGGALVNTAIFTAFSIALQFIVGMLLALYFRKDFPGGAVLRSLLLIPWLLPSIVTGTIWRWMFDQDSGIINVTLQNVGLIEDPIPWLTSGNWAMGSIIIANVWAGIPFCMVLLHSGMRGISDEVYEAASIDGASRLQQFRYLTWPLLKPVSAVVLILSVIYTVKTFDVIWSLTGGGPANATQTLAIYSYVKSFRQFEFGQGAAIGDILVLISLIFGLLYLRAYSRSMREENLA